MRPLPVRSFRFLQCLSIVWTLAVALIATTPQPAQARDLEDLLAAVVRVKTSIEPDGRTVGTLGQKREGSGILIDTEGLVLTIGYLMVEARIAEIGLQDGRTIPATVVGYDHETGFGLLRVIAPPKVPPLELGSSADLKVGDPVLVASFGGPAMASPARVSARRAFAGSWEYLLEDAIFTAPPHPEWSGAALISREGKLVGIGSLVVNDARSGDTAPSNMFVPVERLGPVLGDLLAQGRSAKAGRPWLGLTTNEVNGELVVARVVPGSPAEWAGVQAGDVIAGVDGERPTDLADFYRKVGAMGPAGVVVPLDLARDRAMHHVDIHSINRLDHLKLKSSL
jgi:serine protease Do